MRHEPEAPALSEDEVHLLRPLEHAGPGYYAFVGVLLAVIAWGVIAYVVQLRYGLGVTGMRDYVSWGVYIANFVFFIGVSHVGALMSAILRITGAEWRRPITRMAEAITFASLLMGAIMPVVDMGRPERLWEIFAFGRVQSPVLWDILSISTYLTGSTIFLYLPMIPDIALLRDRLTGVSRWRRWLYRVMALGWRGTPEQWARLERCMGIMAVLIIPIAISVHTVVSWIFGMTLRQGWNSTIFGPYFVSGALYSGAAAVVTAMAAFRWIYRLHRYVTLDHFKKMSYLVLTLGFVYGYFTVAEYLTVGYKMPEAERSLLESLFAGHLGGLFWFAQVAGILVPLFLIILPTIPGLPWPRRLPVLRPQPIAALAGLTAVLMVIAQRLPPWLPQAALTAADIAGVLRVALWILLGALALSMIPVLHARPLLSIVVASVLVNAGAWIKRYVIVVPTLLHPYLPIQGVPWEWAQYRPTWVEWSITAAAFAGFMLVYTVFSRLFPIVSIWETREGAAAAQEKTGPAPHPAPGAGGQFSSAPQAGG
ncbi:MAG: polysulfide reductase NrfD [Armatimonadetes bacterium]|nr:polysulfide reductase NrfD [Armatimonadota bacterium]